MHSIAYGNPETLLGGKFLTGPWADVAQAVQVSAYSLKSLTDGLPAADGGAARVVGLTFDATVAWPGYDWMGVAKAALESATRYLARDLGPQGIRVQPGPRRTAQDPGGQGDPGFRAVRGRSGATRAPLGWDNNDLEPTARGVVRPALRLVPCDHR